MFTSNWIPAFAGMFMRLRCALDHETRGTSFLIPLTLALSHPGNGMKLSYQSFPILGKPEAVGSGAFAAREAPPAAMMRGRGLHEMLDGG
jgi:hypothetical protein